MAAIKTGNFVHVVGTINLTAGEGKILYVNPSTSMMESTAPVDQRVQLIVQGNDGQELHREGVVVRYSSCESSSKSNVGLIQADIPRLAGMKALILTVNNREVSRYEAGEPAGAPKAVGLALAGTVIGVPHRRQLTLPQAAGLQPAVGVTYSVQVKPDNGTHWSTIAVGRPTPHLEIDRNQFPGAKKAEVRVLRTTGFEEEVIAQDTLDLF